MTVWGGSASPAPWLARNGFSARDGVLRQDGSQRASGLDVWLGLFHLDEEVEHLLVCYQDERPVQAKCTYVCVCGLWSLANVWKLAFCWIIDL